MRSILVSAAAAAALSGSPAAAAEFYAVSITKHAMAFMDVQAIEEPEWGERSFTVHQVYDVDQATTTGMAGSQASVRVNCDRGEFSTPRITLVDKNGKLFGGFDPQRPMAKPPADSMATLQIALACTGKPLEGIKLLGPWPTLEEAKAFYFAHPAH